MRPGWVQQQDILCVERKLLQPPAVMETVLVILLLAALPTLPTPGEQPAIAQAGLASLLPCTGARGQWRAETRTSRRLLATLVLRRRSPALAALRGGMGEAGGGEGEQEVSGDVPVPEDADAVTTMEEAEEMWVRATDAAPNNAPLLFDYALFLQDDKGDWLGAERVYKKVLALKPSNVEAASNYATILSEHRDDLNGAECAFQWALALSPNDGTALANYAALVLDKRNEPRRAQELYLHAIRADPTNTATLYNYAALLEEHVGDLRGASRMLQVALSMDPTCRAFRERLASVERRRARRALSRAARKDSGGSSSSWRGRSGGSDGGNVAACAGVERERGLLRAAVLTEPSSALALCDYAGLLLREGSLDNATALFKLSLRQNPLCVDSLVGLGLSMLMSSPSRPSSPPQGSDDGGDRRGGEEGVRAEGQSNKEVQKDVMTIFARAYQLEPAHVGVQQELGELLMDTGYEREGCSILHRLHTQLTHTDRVPASAPSFSRTCLALARYYAESRDGYAGPGARLSELEARHVMKIAAAVDPALAG